LATRPSPYTEKRPSPYRDGKTTETKTKKPTPKEPTQATVPSPVPGFSAGTSKPEPPPPPDHRAQVVGASVLVCVLALGAMLVLTRSTGGSDASNPDPSDPPLANVATTGSGDGTVAPAHPSTTPGHEGEGSGQALASDVVRIVDQGWFVRDEARQGSYGFVIENTSDEVLGPFVVKVTGYDRAGAVVSGLSDWKHIVGTMQPKQRIGIADQLHSMGQADDGISRLDFVVSEVTDDPLETTSVPDTIPDGQVVVGNIKGFPGEFQSRVSFEAASTYTTALEADAYVVFRDSGDRIVGGATSFIDLKPNGTVSGDFEFDSRSVSDDIATIEVYVVPSLTYSGRKSP
jgi:hypothetical protein